MIFIYFYGILKDLELDIRPVDRTRMDADPASGGVRGHCMGGFSAESWMMWMVVSTFDVNQFWFTRFTRLNFGPFKVACKN